MASRNPLPRRVVLVTVGTDHHPFDRLIRWVDAWLETRGADQVTCLVQSGSSFPPRYGESYCFLGHDELERAMSEAVAVVTHGGPGTILDCRRAGLRPIVVPRVGGYGEHVDDHQVAFARRMAAAGEIHLAEDEEDLRRLLDRALADPEAFRIPASGESRDAAVGRFADLVGSLVAGRPVPQGDGPEASPLRILYIAGWGRSGSTLLDRMLGQIPGMFSAGEVREIWQRGCAEDRLCGCGAGFSGCEFWASVGEEAFGGWGNLDLGEVMRLRNRLDRGWSSPALLARRPPGIAEADIRAYAKALERLYRAVQKLSGARVIVDSSKLASHALLLRRIPSADVRIVHLVRDSRGVVFSWQKRVSRPDGRQDGDLMHRYDAASASARWVFYNALARRTKALGMPYLLLRYEDLVADPATQLQRVLQHAGVPYGERALSFLQEGRVALGVDHTVDGNPMRFQRGAVNLRVDDEWRSKMQQSQRLIVSAITSPLLASYGYRIRDGIEAGTEAEAGT